MKKYYKILQISIKNNLVYFKDFIAGNAFLVLIITIDVLLWKNLYSQKVNTGFTYAELIWYLIIVQIVFTNNMNLFSRIEEDIKGGNIAYHLNKPYSYPFYILFDALGKTILNLLANILFGIIIGLCFVGIIPAFSIVNTIPMLIMIFLGSVLNLLIYICISMTSFWFEENKPFIWIYRQLIFALGATKQLYKI